MAALKYSRQRECIKSYLESSYAHPTADTVYMHVKEEFPNISLGTVYRNLNLLTEIGEALKISTPEGGDRFDGHTEPHNHFICNGCGCVHDIEVNEIEDLIETNGNAFDGVVESHSTVFFGRCKKCVDEGK